ncbi:MAG: type 2 isopentenyl-diphosphate Delta-isomerase [Anaerolineales bacterium]|nr:type 2 isopentenyl-diphosphate Delta-isomerase [Anaerolineales bacterium]
MSKVTATSRRKANHIKINLQEDVRSGLTSGLENIHFEHNAVPELDLKEINLSLEFLGRPMEAPILISSMTGGTSEAERINAFLAEAAQAKGIALGVGSQRAALEDASVEKSYQVRRYAPSIPLFANIGAVQLNYGYGIDECQRAVDSIEADALFIHFNPLQEAIQPEGDTNFHALLPKIRILCNNLSVPVIAKEVGWGISADSALRLVDAGVTAIDVAGAGGTSWSQVEMHRAEDESQAKLAASFRTWGIPTVNAVIEVRDALPKIPLIASGGLRSGIDIAKCIAIGADLGGMAGPFLKAAAASRDEVIKVIDLTIAELRACMFATGCATLQDLRNARLLLPE